jgi:galactonate dehydratase
LAPRACGFGLNAGADYLKRPFEVVGGYIEVPEGLGLGIELDEEKVRGGLFAGDWETPVRKQEDGSFAEW